MREHAKRAAGAIQLPVFIRFHRTWGFFGNIVTLDDINDMRYYISMIVSFKDRDTRLLAEGIRVQRFLAIERTARRKLRQLEISAVLEDLRIPPGNRLEALGGSRKGQHSIRINDQFRLCFIWTLAGAENVEIADYH